jgi:hypothetical protein
MTLRIPSSSTEYLHIPVTASVATSGFTVHVAVIPPGSDPGTSDWKTAAWDGNEVVVLVGPAQPIALVGHSTYVVWVKVDAGLEIPVMRSGVLTTD